MQVYLANYNVPNDNNAAYNRQKQVIQDVITTYGTGNVDGVTVGNEYMLKYGPWNCTKGLVAYFRLQLHPSKWRWPSKRSHW